MSYGGGTFLTQNKVLPGAYINFASVVKAASELSDRGYGAMGLELDWGPEGQIFTVEQEDFQEHPEEYFGYDYTSDKLKGLRDLFLNLKTGYFYRLNGGGNKASCVYGTAKYGGICGNNIKIVISKNVDDTTKWDFVTYYNNEVMDTQTGISSMADLADNAFIDWKRDTEIAETVGTNLTMVRTARHPAAQIIVNFWIYWSRTLSIFSSAHQRMKRSRNSMHRTRSA